MKIRPKILKYKISWKSVQKYSNIKFHENPSKNTQISNFTKIRQKYSHIKFHENPSSGSRNVPRGRTDRQTWRIQQSHFEIVRTGLNTLIISYVQVKGSKLFVSARRWPGRHGALCRPHKGGRLYLCHQLKWDIYIHLSLSTWGLSQCRAP